MQRSTLAAAALLSILSYPAWAQSPTDHDAHHPQQTEALAPTQPAPPAAQSGTGQGMMGQDMMGQGMMRQGMMGQGMMGSGSMNMTGGNMPMMNMGMMGMGMMGMGAVDHIEGRIAFLRAELKITDAQSSAWNAFADALRNNAKRLGELRASVMAGGVPQNLADRLTLQEKWLSARLEGTRAIKSALTDLAASFSDDQKKTADELLAPRMGMNRMMGAMPSARARTPDRDDMTQMMGPDWDHRKAGRDWRMRPNDDDDRDYGDDSDRRQHRAKICIEDENGDQYCRYRY